MTRAPLLITAVLVLTAAAGGALASGNDPQDGVVVLAGAGDIAECGNPMSEATARLLDGIPGIVFTLGDNAYPSGTAAQFEECYGPTWGRHRARTRPAAGNHDYKTPGGAGYHTYFGEAAGPPGKGYYSYTAGAWHVVVLNSNCDAVGGCHARSPQVRWLQADLAAHPTRCTLAYFHHPRFSSGSEHGPSHAMLAFWEALYEVGAEVVLSGHEHSYERFAPQDAWGVADPKRGIRQFVVGTGGKTLYPMRHATAHSEVRRDDVYGVLVLRLAPGSYEWRFVSTTGAIADAGAASCHR